MQADLITRLGQAAFAAHDGVHAGQQWWERWNFDPEILIPVALMTALYLRGLYVWRERSRPHPRWRTACYLLGVALSWRRSRRRSMRSPSITSSCT